MRYLKIPMYKTALSENRLVACWEMLSCSTMGLCTCKRTLGHQGRSDPSWHSRNTADLLPKAAPLPPRQQGALNEAHGKIAFQEISHCQEVQSSTLDKSSILENESTFTLSSPLDDSKVISCLITANKNHFCP